MCTAQREAEAPQMANNKSDLAFHVQNMTCGHCAGVITSALTKAFPGISVRTDTVSRIVHVDGARDAKAVGAIISQAGYESTVVS